MPAEVLGRTGRRRDVPARPACSVTQELELRQPLDSEGTVDDGLA